MKYLKLFEKFIDEPKFYRFNQTDLLGQEDIMQLSARQRNMVGPENVNSVLVKNRFPDKKNCIHFMDEKAFNPKYKTIYGRFIFEVKIDNTSKLGWSFFIPVNDWFYKGYPYYHLTRYPEKLPDVVKDLLYSEYGNLDYPYDDADDFEDSPIMRKSFNLEKMADYLQEYKIIGTGTIENLKRNELFGKYPVFVWTNDDVIIKRYVEPAREPREARPYKNRPLLTEEDFTNNGVSSEKIKDFYSSDTGRSLRRLQMRANENPDKFSEFKEEALSVLKVWIQG
jgi:hypothetical protein